MDDAHDHDDDHDHGEHEDHPHRDNHQHEHQEHDEVADEDGEEQVPKLPFELTVGVISMIHPEWWNANHEAVLEAERIVQWLDFRIERRTVGPVIEQPVQRLTMTVEEAARTLGISRASAYEAVARGEIRCIRIGRRILVPRAALEKLLEGATPDGQID